MKKILFLVAILNLLFASSESDAKLDELMQHKSNQDNFSIDYNPFINESMMAAIDNKSVESHTETKRSLRLVAILNQKAYINGQWYRVGQSVNGYKIIKIREQSVELKKDGKTKILAFEEAKELLHVKDSRK
ncbi:MAG: hypothetical protein PHR87_11810 [Sulfurospirillaceae bacterium]|nr:hypothetical protein [Sulfurospirillaceae bacterium]